MKRAAGRLRAALSKLHDQEAAQQRLETAEQQRNEWADRCVYLRERNRQLADALTRIANSHDASSVKSDIARAALASVPAAALREADPGSTRDPGTP